MWAHNMVADHQHPSRRMALTVPLARRDRPWVGAYVSVLVGPFDMPSVDELREAVAKLAHTHPQSRLTWAPDPQRHCWRTDRTPESVVAQRDWTVAADGFGFGTQLDVLTKDDSLPTPLVLVRYDNCIGIRMSHSLGDGRLYLTVMSAVLRTAWQGAAVSWPVESGGRFPLARAAINTFGRHPLLVSRTISDRIGPARTSSERTGAGAPRPWLPSRRCAQSWVPRDQADELFSWGRQFAPRASKFALQVAIILRAMRQAGMQVSTDVRVIVDLRRYLGWRYIDGNFIAGVPMDVDATMSPETISAHISGTNRSGRPLANQLATALRGRGAEPPVDTTVNPAERPRIAFTYMAPVPEIDCLPFLDAAAPVYAGSVPPAGPWGVTVLLGENPAGLSFNATFHDNVVDAGQMNAALQAAAADPIGLLTAAS